jgi:hypothetical protein
MKTLLTAAAIALLSTTAHAQLGMNSEKYVRMPIDFVGEWCSYPEGTSEVGADYVAPSRLADDRPCKNIFGVDKYGLYFFGASTCYPITVRTKEDRAPSGTAYTATIKARCHASGPMGKGRIENYRLELYKGQLSVQNLAELLHIQGKQ